MILISNDTTLDDVKQKVCSKVGIDVSKNTLVMKLLYPNCEGPIDVSDDETWIAYLHDLRRQEPVKLCVNAEPVIDDDESEDRLENTFDLNEQLIVDRGIEDFTPELYNNRNPRDDVVHTPPVSVPHENVIQPNTTFGDQVIDLSSERGYDWGFIANIISQPLDIPYNEQHMGRMCASMNEARTSRQNVDQTTHTPYGQFMRTRMQAPMQTGPTIGGSFTSYLTSPLQQNTDTGHTFGMSSVNRSRGAHFGSGMDLSQIPPCPRAETFQTDNPDVLFIGKRYRDKEDMKDKMSYHALRHDYMWKLVRSDKETLKLRCYTSDRCEWKVVGKRVVDSNVDARDGQRCMNFEITAYTETHTCGLEQLTDNHRQAKPGPIGRFVRDSLIKLGSGFTTKVLQAEVKKTFNIDLNYQSAYQCRQKALELIGGNVEMSYCKLYAYFYMLTVENQGTITNIVPDALGRFKYCFMALGSSIEGFKYCRPILVVDGTHLKTKCDGTLLVAVGVDAGDHIFPLAFAVTDGESLDAWTYFMENLKSIIGERTDLVFISDRGPGIIGAVRNLFPNAYHGYCYHHIVMNLNKKFGSTGYCPFTFWEAAYTYSETRFQILFQKIIEMDIDPTKPVSRYLHEIGIKNWARSQFPSTRYSIMTSNHAESFNNVIRDARKMSIVNLFDYIRGVCQRWHCERRERAESCRTVLAPEPEKLLNDVSRARRNFTLHSIDRDQYQVGDIDSSEIVNMLTRTCYCGQFQGLQLPCVHACAAISHRCESVYAYCSHYYKAACFQRTYEGRVFPVPVEDDWILPEWIKNKLSLTPPEPRVREGGETQRMGARRGRPRTLRIPSQGEPPGARTSRMPTERTTPGSGRNCSNCGNPGHRRNRCPARAVVPN